MCGGGGERGDERRGGKRVEGVVRVDMDRKECVSDGRGGVRVCQGLRVNVKVGVNTLGLTPLLARC